MIDATALNWILTTGAGGIIAGATALVRKVAQQNERLTTLETRIEERDAAMLSRLESMDESLQGLTTFLLNNQRRK